jgi:hypothetical protein
MTEVQYISDSNGKPVGVIVPIDVWEKMRSDDALTRSDRLKKLFKKTQSLPQILPITDEDISREIELYRTGK